MWTYTLAGRWISGWTERASERMNESACNRIGLAVSLDLYNLGPWLCQSVSCCMATVITEMLITRTAKPGSPFLTGLSLRPNDPNGVKVVRQITPEAGTALSLRPLCRGLKAASEFQRQPRRGPLRDEHRQTTKRGWRGETIITFDTD